MNGDLLPQINIVTEQISRKQQEKFEVQTRINILNTEISQLKERTINIDDAIVRLTKRKYQFGRKQYENPDVRSALVAYGITSNDLDMMEMALSIEEKEKASGSEQLSNEMVEFLIVLDNSLREKNSNPDNLFDQLSKDDNPFDEEVRNDN